MSTNLLKADSCGGSRKAHADDFEAFGSGQVAKHLVGDRETQRAVT